jgi:hypothetical protein
LGKGFFLGRLTAEKLVRAVLWIGPLMIIHWQVSRSFFSPSNVCRTHHNGGLQQKAITKTPLSAPARKLGVDVSHHNGGGQ